jgi:membrane protease YdiL (CAAX protease family)
VPALVVFAWLLLTMRLTTWGTALIPDVLKAKITYPQFLIGSQLVTLAVGLVLTWQMVHAPRHTLGLRWPRPAQLTTVLLLAPLTYLIASVTAIRIALPYLLEELAERGPGVAREAAGEMGRQLGHGPLVTTLVWGALLAAVGEELLFRGALWSTIEQLVPKRAIAESDRLHRTAARLYRAIPGLVATLVSAGIFGVLHYDMRGAVGIVHAVATTCLALACGLTRHVTRSVIPPILLHFLYNTLVIGLSRRWFGDAADPLLPGVPNTLVYLAGIGVLGALGLAALRRARRRATVVWSAP